MEQKIVRYVTAEMRAADASANADGERIVEGYALKFNERTQIGSGDWAWIEEIDPSAMDNADLSDVILNFNHDWDNLLARTKNNSLQLIVDDIGLKIIATLDDTQLGVDTYKRIQSGLINRMSFAVQVTANVWSEAEGEMDHRKITGFGRFYDVSAVTFPAYEQTEITARSGISETDDLVKEHFEKRSGTNVKEDVTSAAAKMNAALENLKKIIY